MSSIKNWNHTLYCRVIINCLLSLHLPMLKLCFYVLKNVAQISHLNLINITDTIHLTITAAVSFIICRHWFMSWLRRCAVCSSLSWTWWDHLLASPFHRLPSPLTLRFQFFASFNHKKEYLNHLCKYIPLRSLQMYGLPLYWVHSLSRGRTKPIRQTWTHKNISSPAEWCAENEMNIPLAEFV